MGRDIIILLIPCFSASEEMRDKPNEVSSKEQERGGDKSAST